ncbi:hypothetical protein C0V77_20705 [Emticicia sp. TH156]|nr:hypothetical protein C0V77_20705 [Emticicia sp. TH156]
MLFITFVNGTFAQDDTSTDEFGKLNIATVMPSELEGFTAGHLKKIETKILSLLNQSGISSRGVDNGVILYPVISIFNEQTINPGLQTMTVIDGELSLFIKQADDKLVFSTITKRVKGSGRTRDQAINNLISLLPTKSDEYGDFIIKAKTKIIDYYNKRCDMLIAKADQLSKANKHDQAISMLFSIPAETDCYRKSREKSLEIYKNYQNYTCAKLVSQAKAKLSANQYEEGFAVLSKVDPSSNCAKEVEALYKQHGNEVDANVKRYWDFWEKIYLNKIEAEKYRWKAMSELAVLYVTNNARSYDYIRVK